jgi:hypothetical protein
MALIRPDKYLLALLLLALTLYSAGLSGPLFFDDAPAITANPLMQIDGTEFDQWRTASLSSRSGPLRRPVAMFSFAVNQVSAGETSAFSLKLLNVLIHLMVGALVYLLSQNLVKLAFPELNRLKSSWVALLAAGIWLLHPLHVSTVLYAVQRMTQLSALFSMAGLLLFVHYRQRWASDGAGLGEFVGAALWLSLLLLAAVYSKENGLLMLPLIVVIEVCFFRGRWGRVERPALRYTAVALLCLYGAAMVAAAFVPPDFISQRFNGREFTLEERVLTQSRILWHYLGWLALPDLSAMGFQHDDIPLSRGMLAPVTTVLSILGWLSVILLGITLRKRYPLLLFGLLFYLVGHSMESSILPLEMVYEHRNYLPSMGICLVLASVLLVPALNSAQFNPRLVLLGVPLILGLLLWVRVDTWSDELRLMGVNATNHPQSSRSSYFYANALLDHFYQREQLGLSPEEARESLITARVYFERMYQSNPRDVAALVMLHSLDSQFAASAENGVDWFAKLEELLSSRVLQPSDYNALGALISCINAGGCAVEHQRVVDMLAALRERFPRNVSFLGYQYSYLSARGAPVAELKAILEEALRLSPHHSTYRYRLIELYARENNVDGMYEQVGRWLHYDRRRLELANLKKLFSTAATDRGQP